MTESPWVSKSGLPRVGIGSNLESWPNRLLRPLKRMVGSIGVDVFPYVSCFGNSFGDKDSELPVSLTFKNNVRIDGIL